ncbi:MAG TPA: MlaE family lipid ABC transporter permease subunit [Alphaproteobacteria bacterium]|nr:MlaE family lipid ABC transporter permease subunit [Alphaproteobacteria bacterium]
MAAAELTIGGEGEYLILRAVGRWTGEGAAALDGRLRRLDAEGFHRVRFDLGAVDAMDTVGAWLLKRTGAELRERGLEVELANVPGAIAPLLERVGEITAPVVSGPRRPPRILQLLDRIGAGTIGAVRFGYDLLGFFGLVSLRLFRVAAQPWRLRLTATVRHLEETGFNALPIVGLISLLVGLVLAYQGVDQLRPFGAEVFMVNLVGIAALREMGILLTAIVVAGRSGSAFTAEIGTMKVNEEVDALSTLGLDPIEILVLPRLIALMIALPLLTFFADIMALLGGAIGGLLLIDLTFPQFLQQLSTAITPTMFWVGMVKAPVFAFVIAMVGCFEGLRVAGSAESVGRLTTKSVVESIFLVIVLDALFSILFSILGV